MSKTVKNSCIVSLACIAAEIIYSIILKSQSSPSSIVIGEEGARSLVYFMPAAAGGILYLLIAFTAFLSVSSFKAFAKGSFVKFFAFFGVWILQAGAALFSVIKVSTMEMFSFENNILRIAQFVIVLFALVSCIAVRRMKTKA